MEGYREPPLPASHSTSSASPFAAQASDHEMGESIPIAPQLQMPQPRRQARLENAPAELQSPSGQTVFHSHASEHAVRPRFGQPSRIGTADPIARLLQAGTSHGAPAPSIHSVHSTHSNPETQIPRMRRHLDQGAEALRRLQQEQEKAKVEALTRETQLLNDIPNRMQVEINKQLHALRADILEETTRMLAAKDQEIAEQQRRIANQDAEIGNLQARIYQAEQWTHATTEDIRRVQANVGRMDQRITGLGKSQDEGLKNIINSAAIAIEKVAARVATLEQESNAQSVIDWIQRGTQEKGKNPDRGEGRAPPPTPPQGPPMPPPRGPTPPPPSPSSSPSGRTHISIRSRTPPPTRHHQRPLDIKIDAPKKFTGQRKDLDNFEFSLKEYLRLKRVERDEDKLGVLISRLDGEALTWYRVAGLGGDFQEHMKQLRERFGDAQAKVNAMAELTRLTQGTTPTAEFFTKLEELNLRAQLPEDTLPSLMETKLRGTLQQALAMNITTDNSYATWKRLAIRVGTQQENASKFSFRHNDSRSQQSSKDRRPFKTTTDTATSGSFVRVPQHIKEARRKAGECIQCGNQHDSRPCRKGWSLKPSDKVDSSQPSRTVKMITAGGTGKRKREEDTTSSTPKKRGPKVGEVRITELNSDDEEMADEDKGESGKE